eukprot:jgi/Hompol1/3123/HPOL_003126-RA
MTVSALQAKVSAATFSDIPVELLAEIFSWLDFQSQFPRLPLVHRKWRAALGDVKASSNTSVMLLAFNATTIANACIARLQSVRIVANEAVERMTLPKILAMFPLMQVLRLEAGSHSKHNAMLIHRVAAQFEGHPCLRRIISDSDAIMRGTLIGNRCPRLDTLVLSSDMGMCSQDEDITFEVQHINATIAASTNQAHEMFGPQGYRNVGSIIRAIPGIRHITIDNPTFWRREPSTGSSSTATDLQTLKMTTVSSLALSNFLQWLSQSPSRLPNLKTLSLEIDYFHMPSNAIKAIATGCPNLEVLKIKYGILPREALFDIATHMVGLKKLHLSKSDLWFVSQNWAHVCAFLAANLAASQPFDSNCSSQVPVIEEARVHRGKRLEALSFDTCTIQYLEEPEWHAMFDSIAQHPVGACNGVKDLKILDTGDSRPDASVLHALAVLFPRLTTFRIDITGDCFPAFDPVFLGNVRKGWRHLERLELRVGKIRPLGDPVKRYVGRADLNDLSNATLQNQDIAMPKLRRLSVWSFLEFPHFLIRPNVSHITELHINFVSMITPAQRGAGAHPQRDNRYSFPVLRELEIRAISNAAHQLCVESLNIVQQHDDGTFKLPRLRRLVLDAMSRNTSPIQWQTLSQLTRSAPDLRYLRTSGFIWPQQGLSRLSDSWPDLESLEIVGLHSIGVASEAWETAELEPFMQGHRKLHRLTLGVSDLDVDGFKLLDSESIMSRLMIRGSIGPSDFDGEFVHAVKSANQLMYTRYAERIRDKYFWIRECSVRGPYETIR